MKFKILDEDLLKHYLNKALNECLEKEKIKINPLLEGEIGLELSYDKLLTEFEEHLKDIIETNEQVKE